MPMAMVVIGVGFDSAKRKEGRCSSGTPSRAHDNNCGIVGKEAAPNQVLGQPIRQDLTHQTGEKNLNDRIEPTKRHLNIHWGR